MKNGRKQKTTLKIVLIIVIVTVILFSFICCDGLQGNSGHTHEYNTGICTRCYGFVMVQIPAGTFSMGQEDMAISVRGVTLSAFKMSKYTVTQELYMAVTGINPSHSNGGYGRRAAAGEKQGLRPVVFVTWFDAVEFCNRLSEWEGLTPVYMITDRYPDSGYPINEATVSANWNANGYRLPTEAEWEYACRAGTTTQWSFGDTDTDIDDYVWYRDNSDYMTHQVGLKLPNAWGLHDMHGNVQEWCWDRNGYYVDDLPNLDPTGPVNGTGRVFRGGSSYFDTLDTRSAYYDFYYPEVQFRDIGFRVVRRP